ncbi:MAG TPA: hypothetical protein VK701_02685, partial [Solirubrobacteraceae bacterium]|nr:hypothetical protein [Solirubrobacteraceae bacterium]
VNGQAVDPPQHQIDRASLLPLAGEISGREVRGWAAMLLVSSQRGWYGFDLVRHRRVIRRHEKIGFQAHPQNARVVGELHLDEFETNNLKTDFVRETEAWRELETWLSEAIEPVVVASRTLAHGGAFDQRLRELITRERNEINARLGEGVMDDVLEIKRLPESSVMPSDAIGIVVGPFHVEHIFIRDPSGPYMRRQRLGRPGESDLIRVATNLAYPHVRGEIATWGCHNVAEALALELGSADDYIETKSRVWASLVEMRGLATELRRSARRDDFEPAAEGAS